MAVMMSKDAGFSTSLKVDPFERVLFGFQDFPTRDRCNKMLEQSLKDQHILSQCFELRFNKLVTGKCLGKEDILRHFHGVIPGRGFPFNEYCSERKQRSQEAYCNFGEKNIEMQGCNEEKKDDQFGVPNPATNNLNCQVPVIARVPKKKARKGKEARCSNYIYNPMPIRTKSRKKHVLPEAKDNEYWVQRVKNNVSARKSREERRRKEIEMVEKCESLLNENCQLRQENYILQTKLQVMESMTYGKFGDKF